MTMLPAFAPLIVAALVLMLWVMLMAQAWQQSRSRRQLQRDLARIFEQLDLLALAAPVQVAPGAPAAAGRRGNTAAARGRTAADDGDTVSELIAAGASERELVTRCGIAPAEARIMIAMRGNAHRAGASR